MKRLRNHCVGIDQGERTLFSDFEIDGPMWKGKGPRIARIPVEFDEKFREEPSVMLSISMWDMDSVPNARMDLRAEDITENGFNIVFRTWGDSRVARVRATWMAIGEVRDGDEWILY